MSFRKSPLFYAALIAVTALTVIAVRFAGTDGHESGVAFPVAPDDYGGEAQDALLESLRRAEITPETVQAVVATLRRAESYSRKLSVQLFWEGGESTHEIEVWAKDGMYKIIADGPGGAEHTLIRDGTVWRWPDGGTDYYKGKAEAGSESDGFQMLITYEELLTVDIADIADAGYDESGGEPYIFARYVKSELGYESVVRVSVTTGLLLGGERYDGETLVYRMSAGEADLTVPDESVFTPPSP